MAQILLTTMNARYYHASFGLRYLLANMGPLFDQTQIKEYTISQPAAEIVADMLRNTPKIIGIGVYIWNATLALEVVRLLKAQRPEIKVVLGGPEVSHEVDQQEICELADVTISGEADLTFAEVCQQLLDDQTVPQHVPAKIVSMDEIELPYHLYNDEDIANRIIYVEASRGCPFRCQFCLSSLNIPVRKPSVERFLEEMQQLLDRGVRHFKFVDRTFNLSTKVSGAILDFFLERYTSGLYLHFEMIPDRLPEALKERIAAFPPGAMQLEVGIQTWNDDVAARIQRRLNRPKTTENLQYLRAHTGVHIHADLIAGLPGEDWDSFAAGFDAVWALNPQEIQVGILKRLRGTPIKVHDETYGMHYEATPPYEVKQTRHMPSEQLDFIKQLASLWDRIANSGYFNDTLPLLLSGPSPFEQFQDWTKWFYQRNGVSYGHSLTKLEEELYLYLTESAQHPPSAAARALILDRKRLGQTIPRWLKQHAPETSSIKGHRPSAHRIPKRQARHLRASIKAN